MNLKKRHKILFISSWFPNKLEPTNGNFVQRHAEAVSLLHDVEVLHAIGDFKQKEKFVFDDKIINGIRTLIVYYKNSKNPFQNFLKRMRAYQLGFKKIQKPDLVHGNVLHNNMLFAFYLKLKHKIPYVISEHWDIFQIQHHYRISFAKKFIIKLIASKVSYLLPVSNDLKVGLEKLGISAQIKTIGNVVDVVLFSVPSKKEELFTFLHISNLVSLKNPETIIRVAAKLYQNYAQFQLKIGGDGNLDELNNWIEKYNAKSFSETFGMISHEEVAEKMKQAHCFVLFSNSETQGIVLLEAFSAGVPVIATNVGGIPEIGNKSRGILVENTDESTLYDAMKNVLVANVTFETPEKIRQFVVSDFSKECIAEKFSEIYNLVLS